MINFATVTETTDGLSVCSIHEIWEEAAQKRDELKLEFPTRIFAAVRPWGLDIKGQDVNFEIGDIIKFEQIHWMKQPSSCSICCHPFNWKPTSLNYKCIVSCGKCPCDALQFAKGSPIGDV